jgi:hypothetical protein
MLKMGCKMQSSTPYSISDHLEMIPSSGPGSLPSLPEHFIVPEENRLESINCLYLLRKTTPLFLMYMARIIWRNGRRSCWPLWMFEIGGLSLEEIRKVQNEKSISAVKSRLSRTRLKLRNTIIEMEKINYEQGGKYDIKSWIPGR